MDDLETYRSGHNGADSKSVCRQRHVGSNPTVSAIEKEPPLGGSFSIKSVGYECHQCNAADIPPLLFQC